MNKLKITYTNETNIPEMDKAFEQVAKQFGYKFIGKGYNFKTHMRDLEFKKGK